MPEFTIETNAKQELIDITDKINEIIKGVKKGICNVFVLHATAAIVINENDDPNICDDFLKALNKAIPEHDGYMHDKIDNNAGAHIKAALLGPGENIPVTDGKLLLGRWQSIMLVELDGPRQRRISVEVIGN